MHITFDYRIASSRVGKRAQLHCDLIELLRAVDKADSLAAAADALGVSYRHLWGQLRHWEETLGIALTERTRGSHTRLSEAGVRLLRSEKAVLARNAALLEKLANDLEQTYADVMYPDAHELRVTGCPDRSLLRFKNLAAPAGVRLLIDFNSSAKGLEDLAAGRTDIAGFNAPSDTRKGDLAAKVFAPLIDPEKTVIIKYASRSQGMAVAPGNPLELHSISDVASTRARYVNRAEGTGTRVLLDALLVREDIAPELIVGYDNIASGHQAVAQSIFEGKADAGLCIRTSADDWGLDFVPLMTETYFLAVRREDFDKPEMQTLLSILRTSEWREQCSQFAGYMGRDSGTVLEGDRALRWLAR